jgi:hypothetical protein
MIQKNALFYMANLEPEIGRMFRAYDSGKNEIADKFRDKSLQIVDTILESKEVKPAGREEWFGIRNLIAGYDKLDLYSRKVLENFGLPFSMKFMSQYAGGKALNTN